MSEPDSVPMLFLRVAWMKSYQGQSEDDEMHGGGSFVRQEGYGHEMFNFLPHKGRVYGYVRPIRGTGNFDDGAGIKLERLGASRADSELKGVLVVWGASPPTGGTFIIGWYRNATVYRECQSPPPDTNRVFKGEAFNYYVSAAADDAILLDATARNFPLPYQQKGGMGQSMVWYADSPEQHDALRREVLRYIRTGGHSSSKTPAGTGTVRQADPLLRCKVERAAIEVATKHFENQNYVVDSREQDNLGWDLDATCGKRHLRLEVKGLSGSDVCIELTPNEYAQMQKWQDSYFICVVTEALTAPALAVFGYSPESGRWQDDQGRTLEIQPIVAARCKAN